MRIILVILFLGLGLNAHLYAQQNGVEITPVWKKGDSRQYVLLEERSHYLADTLIRIDTIRHFDMDFIVMDSLEDGYEISCLMTNSRLRNRLLDEQDPFFQSFYKEYGTITYRYRTDVTGAFLVLENADEIDSVLDNALSVGGTNETSKQVLDALKDQRERLGSDWWKLYSIEIEQFHFPYGYTYIEGDTVYYADEMMIPMFGASIPTTGSVWIDRIVGSSNTCMINHHIVPDSEALAHAVNEFLERIILTANISEEVKRKLIADRVMQLNDKHFLSINNKTEYHMDYGAGWPLSIIFHSENILNEPGEKTKRIVTSKRFQQVQ